MPQILVSHDSSKTFITNLDLVAKSLHRNPLHILKFMSIEMGCQCINEKYTLNGCFDMGKIQASVYDFIDMFVLCKCCKNPETKFIYEEKLKRRCNSCGEEFLQDDHKINKIILKTQDDVNEDKKYEMTDYFGEKSEKQVNVFKNFIKAKELPESIKNENIETVLENIEEMLELNKKEDKIEGYLSALIKLGFTPEEIEKYFSKPRQGKKRSPLIKKNAEYYLNNLDY